MMYVVVGLVLLCCVYLAVAVVVGYRYVYEGRLRHSRLYMVATGVLVVYLGVAGSVIVPISYYVMVLSGNVGEVLVAGLVIVMYIVVCVRI